jgi:hypothetical protein
MARIIRADTLNIDCDLLKVERDSVSEHQRAEFERFCSRLHNLHTAYIERGWIEKNSENVTKFFSTEKLQNVSKDFQQTIKGIREKVSF